MKNKATQIAISAALLAIQNGTKISNRELALACSQFAMSATGGEPDLTEVISEIETAK